MWKLVFFVAFVADIVLIVYSTDSSSGSSSSSSSSSNSNAGSSSGSSGSSNSNSGGNCGDDDCDDTPVCKPNEVYSSCSNGGCYSARKCCEIGNLMVCVDPKECEGGCLCADGYLRSDNGTCVPVNDCPNAPQCGPNEIYDLCPPTCPPQECGVDPSVILCAPNPKIGDPTCKAGCRCNDGYVRNKDGICVSKDQCPDKKCTKPNEEYVSCPVTCPPQTCESIGKEYNCPLNNPADESNCNGACRCKSGFYRNSIGDCISEDNCLKCSGPNEYYSCGGACDNVCDTLSEQNKTSCPIINIKCNEMCYCEDGYARDENNICVQFAECTEPVSCNGDPNAQPGCGINCNRRCSDYKYPGSVGCAQVCYIDGCDCKKGYVLDTNTGKCVLPKECTPDCAANEVYSSCSNGGCYSARKCSQIGNPTVCVDPLECEGGCLCADGYLRNDSDTCVPVGECPNAPTCDGQNEMFDLCPALCPPQECDVDPNLVDCAPNPEVGDPRCKPGCRCIDGYAINDGGVCVPRDQCCTHTCDNPNEVYDECPVTCPAQRCDVDTRLIKCKAPPKPGDPECEPGCRCADGYLRNKDNVCVKKNDCDSCRGDPNAHPGCGINCGRLCSNYKHPENVACIEVCYDGCDCNDGYVLDTNTEKCVLPNQCTPQCTNPNEEYINCTYSCPPQTCESIGKSYSCPAQTESNCVGACKCVSGYYRNAIGDCILEENCKKCSGPNEYYSCGGACDNVCSTLSEQNQTNCPIINVKCNEMCYCEKGYARDANNICVLIKDCSNPAETCTGANEEYDCCPQTCPPQTCDSIRKEYHCPLQKTDEKDCKGACRCTSGYYRNTLGECISEENCLQCTGQNEFYHPCPPSCSPETCDSIGKEIDCPITAAVCRPNCRCNPDYYRNSSGTCVPQNECSDSPTCGVNEEYSSCIQSICRHQNCTEQRKSVKCVRIDPKYCKEGCICKEHYLRDQNGNCIPEDQCGNTCTTTPPPVTITPKTPCNDNDDDTHDDTNVDEARERYIEGLNVFNMDFFEEMLKTNDGSFIFSAFSVGVPLAELFLYCSGESLEQLKKLLNLNTKDEIREVFKGLQNSIQSHDVIEFDMAAKVYVNENYPLSKAFLDDTQNVFNASAENVDCSNPEQAAATINQWVEDNTNKKIKNLISPTAISLDTRLMLLNAIYFKGDWLYQFNPNDTEKMDFHVDHDTTIQVDTMYQMDKFNYAEIEDLNAKVLQLPYVNEDYTFVAFLPNDLDGLETLVIKLQDTQKFDDAINKLTNQTVKIWLPSFEINTDINLGDFLQKLGVTLLFDPVNSGLDGILETYEPLFITDAIQKAYIKVNEQGSEAAAANAVIAGTTSATINPPVIPEFKADHPFLFYILYEDIITFCGAYRDDN